MVRTKLCFHTKTYGDCSSGIGHYVVKNGIGSVQLLETRLAVSHFVLFSAEGVYILAKR